MIQNFIIVSSADHAFGRFQLKLGEQNVPLKSPSLVSVTDLAWVVISQEPGTLQMIRFVFTSQRSDRWIDQLNITTGILIIPFLCNPIFVQACFIRIYIKMLGNVTLLMIKECKINDFETPVWSSNKTLQKPSLQIVT